MTKNKNLKTEVVQIRLTPEQKLRLLQEADLRGVTLTALISGALHAAVPGIPEAKDIRRAK